jgi:hypothetical protein
MLMFVETPLFSRLVYEYISDVEYAALQSELAQRPEAGTVVPGSGGVRKIRWGVAGRGKRGGVRVIYFARTHLGKIWMLTIYAKNEMGNISPNALRKIRQELEDAETSS